MQPTDDWIARVSHARRRTTDADGQLTPEFRGRVLSGLHVERVEALHSLSALIADVGAPCWATGPTAGALHEFDGLLIRPPFHVLVMRGRNVRRIGHVVHTTSYLPAIDREEVFGVPCLSPTRALISLADALEGEALTAALDGALRDGKTTEDFLHRRIHAVRAKGRHGIPDLLEAMEGREITRGGHSWLEREFLRLVHQSGLPRPSTQQVHSRGDHHLMRVDFAWPGTPVVVETLGYRWHRTGAQMASDAARMNRLVLDGRIPLQFTYSQVVGDAPTVIAAVEEALLPHLGRESLPKSA